MRFWQKDYTYLFNGLQVNGEGVFYRDFTKSLIIRDFDYVLKNPFRYVDLFLLHTLLSVPENHHARPVTESSKLRCKPLHRGTLGQIW